MGNTEQEREAIKQVYPDSQSWANKVNKMSPRQVTAIYLRFKAQGRLK